ncbi:undecaprenyldiphospho-muramoylpentapeptide beta-N-acetylglucosaminyltransferase [Radiobacillus sp. PE A8.2]|uniref:undecaprenyldiphospho-muramoylpentapeptide beta-N-acetylglucosaminyltransferase n=1 Tax=Radiobacillus sp. PE A8.2 TaxID=3380349 RepID=UPI00388E494D
MSDKRILFTGGGTAGHVIVNLAIIPVFQQEGWEIDYIGSKNGIEKELISQLDGVTYHPISTGKLRRYLSIENMKDPFKVIKGTLQAFRILGKRKPSVVFSKGGFVSVPVLVAAWLRRIPAVIHESDITPGLANKIAIPLAKKVLTTFPETMQYVPEEKSEWAGAVVRNQLFRGSKQKGLDITKLKPNDKPVLLIMGGSGGAQRINQAVREQLPNLLKEFQIIHLCGKGNVDESLRVEGYAQFDYVNQELSDIFAATDFVLSRAGSNAIFEFLALKKPMLLIPLPLSSSRGDQILNAKSFKKQGYANMLEEEQLTGDRLLEELKQLKQGKTEILNSMRNYESYQAKDSVVKIIKEVGK